jgi:nitrilase
MGYFRQNATTLRRGQPYGVLRRGTGCGMRAAAIQIQAGTDKAANIANVAPLIEQAAAKGATLVSLPEMWTCLGGDRAAKLDQAETLPMPGRAAPEGSAWRFLRDTARRLGITLHGGSIGEREGDTLFNTSVVFAPGGAELARYRKIHLFDVTTPGGAGYRESSLFGAGETVVTCQAGRARLGLAICYDVRFPELFLALRRAGADAIMVPSAFTAETGRDHWEVLLRARAIETQCWVVAAATTGTHVDAAGRTRATWGHSMIIDPWGTIRATLADAPGVTLADIDLESVASVRAAMPVLDHRRLA